MIKPLLLLGITAQMLLAVPSVKWLNEGESIDGSVKYKEKLYYKVRIEPNRQLKVKLNNLNADIDLYVSQGQFPSIRHNDCYSANGSTKNEECTVVLSKKASLPKSREINIMVYGFRASKFTLETISEEAKYPDELTINKGVKKHINFNASEDFIFYGRDGITYDITLNQLTADADLRVSTGRKATMHYFDCKSTKGGTQEDSCTITVKEDDTIFMNVHGYNDADYQLTIKTKKMNKPPITLDELKQMIFRNQDISQVNTSQITDMSYLFSGRDNFNDDISNWDVSNVTNMEGMFSSASGFNVPIGKWDVSNVTNMNGMFRNTESFNQPIGNWNVSNVTNMADMFNDADKFNQPIDNWNVSNVTNMTGMFSQAEKFNQPIGNWNVSNVTNMTGMFSQAEKFNQPIGNWNVSNVTNISNMFNSASNFNQPIGNWNVSKVTNISNMFSSASNFNQPIENWDVSNVTDMRDMFWNASSFNQSINSWNVANVTNMENMFTEASSFNQPLNSWNVANVTDMKNMFFKAKNFTNQDLSNWSVKKVSVHHTKFLKDAGKNNIEPKWVQSSCISREDLEKKIQNNEDITKVDVSCIRDMGKLFMDNTSFNQDISGWDVSNVTSMYGMFSRATGFKNHDLSKWNVKKVQYHNFFFENAGENNTEPKWNN